MIRKSGHGWRLQSRVLHTGLGFLFLLGLSACTSTSPIPPRDLTAALTPTQSEKASAPKSANDPLLGNESAQATMALKPDAAPASPSTKAVSSISTATSPVKEAETKTAVADAAKAKPVARPKTAEKPGEDSAKKPKPANQGLASLFQPKPSSKRSVASVNLKEDPSGGVVRNKAAIKRRNVLATRSSEKPVATVSRRSGSLPGVRSSTSLFGIFGGKKRNKDLDGPVELASVTNMARRGNFGLLLQTPRVQVGCFPRSLVRLLKQVERHYGRTPIVTSGYRSASRNRRIRGARNSTHISCKAADIQVKGVSKWQLAKYLRSLPGRGGVGTYCHTKSVHIDIGKKRDWNWRCRRRKRR